MPVRKSLIKKTTKDDGNLFKFVQYDFDEAKEYEGKIVDADFKDSIYGKRFVVRVMLDKYAEREFFMSIPVDNAKGSLFFRFCADMELLTARGANLEKLKSDSRRILATMKCSKDGTYFVSKMHWMSKDEETDEDEEDDESDENDEEEWEEN
ncbi:MAG: hypothetical protein ACI39Q_07680 [Wujia sp.]